MREAEAVETVKKLYEFFTKRDRTALKAVCSENISWTQNPGFPGGGVNTGIEDIIKNVFEANQERWEQFSFGPLTFSAMENKVLVEGHYVVKSKATSEASRCQTAHVFTLENGKVIAFQQYTDTKKLWDNYKGAAK